MSKYCYVSLHWASAELNLVCVLLNAEIWLHLGQLLSYLSAEGLEICILPQSLHRWENNVEERVISI